jgi:hypothetical protein
MLGPVKTWVLFEAVNKIHVYYKIMRILVSLEHQFSSCVNMTPILNVVLWPSTVHRKESVKGLKGGEFCNHPSEYWVLTWEGGDNVYLADVDRPLPPQWLSVSQLGLWSMEIMKVERLICHLSCWRFLIYVCYPKVIDVVTCLVTRRGV